VPPRGVPLDVPLQPGAAGRSGVVGRADLSMGRHAARPTHRTWGQRAVLAFNGLAALVCVAVALSLLWTWQQVREIPRVELGSQLAPAAEGEAADGLPQNVLIVGTDSADGLADDDPVRIGRDAGIRSDTIMLLRVDPASEQAALLSLPRDLYVPIAGTGRSARINAAIQSGPGRLVATITDAFDLPVHHYIEVDFAGFRDLVEAIDGVPIYFPEPVRDRRSGLDVRTTGCVTLDPVQALAYARSRAYEVQRDGRWVVDGSGDLGRITRQQHFIRQSLHRAFQRGARNPVVLAELVEAGFGAITLDSTITLSDLSAIAMRFRSFDPDALVTYGLPVTPDVVGGADVLRLREQEAQRVLDIFRGADPRQVAVDNTVVEVRNGTATPGLAEDAATALRQLGFVIPPDNTGDAGSVDIPTTVVQYVAGSEARAALVARALGADPAVEEVDELTGTHVRIVIGADWPGLATALRPATPGLVPTTAPPPTTTTLAGTATSETTVPPGEQPAEPPAGTSC
jgi:LCP family protein required for cell wall assembly